MVVALLLWIGLQPQTSAALQQHAHAHGGPHHSIMTMVEKAAHAPIVSSVMSSLTPHAKYRNASLVLEDDRDYLAFRFVPHTRLIFSFQQGISRFWQCSSSSDFPKSGHNLPITAAIRATLLPFVPVITLRNGPP